MSRAEGRTKYETVIETKVSVFDGDLAGGSNMAYEKAFVSDFDGTLFFADRDVRVRPEDIAAIEEFQKQGYLFGVCSGRTFAEVKRLTENKIHFDFAVTSSGACVYGLDNTLEIHNSIDRNAAENILDYVERNYHIEGNLHITENKQISDVTFHPATEEDAEKMAKDLEGKYFSFVVAIPSNRSVNVIPLGSAKRLGVREIKEHYDIKTVYAAADTVSAYSLFQGADVNYAVKWGQSEMIDFADATVDSVAEALELAAKD